MSCFWGGETLLGVGLFPARSSLLSFIFHICFRISWGVQNRQVGWLRMALLLVQLEALREFRDAEFIGLVAELFEYIEGM